MILCLLPLSRLHAQADDPGSATRTQSRTVVGRVVDTRARPVARARIAELGTTRQVLAGIDGVFRITFGAGALGPGATPRLDVRQLGFAPETVMVAARAQSSDTLQVVLRDARTDLLGLVVRADPDRPLAVSSTAAMLRQSPALGEPDVFRTLPLLASIAQPNDAINRLHLAGGASDEHAITLDGHPLQSPFHVASVLGAFNVAALDRADVIMHHLPSGQDGYLAGQIALETKRATQRASRELVVSLLSASATVSQAVGKTDLLVSSRATYLDQVLRLYARRDEEASDDLLLPGYRDALLRVSRDFGEGWSADMLGYYTRDADQASTLRPGERPAAWGERLLGLRAQFAGAQWHGEGKLSVNTADVERVALVRTPTATDNGLATVDLQQRWQTVALSATRSLARWRMRGDLSVRARTHDHRWDESFVRSGLKTPVPLEIDARSRQVATGLGLEADYLGATRWRATAGAHVSVVGGHAYAAPRLLVSSELRPALRLDLALNRRFQFDAIAGEPPEGTTTQPVFFLATPRRADVASAALSWQRPTSPTGRRASVTLTTYARTYHDRTYVAPLKARVADSMPATATERAELAVDFSRVAPAFTRVNGATVGATLSADVVAPSGFVLHVSYTAQRALERIAGRVQPTAWDAPHQLSTFVSVPLTTRWSVTSSVFAHSGAAVTPVEARFFVPLVGGPYGARYVYGQANAARLPGYARVDLGTRVRWRVRGADWALSAQVINALNRVNGLVYDQTTFFSCLSSPNSCADGGASKRSLPLLPSLGLEIAW